MYQKKEKVEKQCVRCGRIFMTFGKRLYCSSRCQYEPRSKVRCKCMECGRVFMGPANKMYCSEDCNRAYLKNRGKVKPPTEL